MTTSRNSGGQRVRNGMLKDLHQFDRQLENTVNTINTIRTGRAKGLDPVTTFFDKCPFLFFVFSAELCSFISVDLGQKSGYYTIESLKL